MKDIKKTDLILIPAVYGDINKAIKANKDVIPWIRKMYCQGREAASLCNGAFLLTETGLIKGKKCSTHLAYFILFWDIYPEVEIADGAVIVDEGQKYQPKEL